MQKITKEKFIQSVVYKAPTQTQKSLAAELSISEAYFYKLFKKYSHEIESALVEKKNSLRLKAMNVIDYHLNKNDLKAAIAVIKLIDWHEENAGGIETVDFKFVTITKDNFEEYRRHK